MLEEPKLHSDPLPVSVPFSVTPPSASNDSEPREATVAPASTATVAAPGAEAPAARVGINQFRSDTASRPAVPPDSLESVMDCCAGSAASAVPDAAEVV